MSGLLANELLKNQLNTYGYHQSKLVPGLWTREWRPIQFTLVVDDFGVKYIGDEHPQHLLQALLDHYQVTTDWTGSRYIGITLDWDYAKHQVHLSMSGYIDNALQQFQHAKLQVPQQATFPSVPIKYGARKQYAKYLLPHRLWTSKVRNSSNKSVENSFSLDGQLTLHSSASLAPLLPNQLNPLWRHSSRQCNS